MKILAFLGTDETAEAAFKRDGDAWIFQTPPLRAVFGVNRSYRIDDTQKAALKKMFIRTYEYSFVAAMVLLPAFVATLHLSGGAFGWRQIAAIGAVSFLFSVVAWSFYFRALRKLLPDRQAISENISFRERMSTYINTMPMWRAVMFTTISIVLLAGALLAFADNSNPEINKLGVVMFSALTIYFSAILVKKMISRQTAL